MTQQGDNASKALLSYIHRFERLAEEADEHKALVKDLGIEAKANGYDLKTIRKILKERKAIRDKGLDSVREELYLEDTYKKALAQAGEPMGYEGDFEDV